MTDLATTRRGNVQGARAMPNALANIKARYLAPLDPANIDRGLIRAVIELGDSHRRLSPRWWEACREFVQNAAPDTLTALRGRARALRQATEAEADRRAASVLLALLVDSYPSGRPANVEVYLDTIIFDVIDMGFAPGELALACQEIRRTMKFLPAAAEVVAACQVARSTWASALSLAEVAAESAERIYAIAALPEPSTGPAMSSRRLGEPPFSDTLEVPVAMTRAPIEGDLKS